VRLPAEQRRRQLLDVAGEVFAERGFAATTMDEVAQAAGVTKPVLYQHFSSKRDMFVELLDDMGAKLLGELAEATGRATSGRERVEEGFAAYFRFVDSHRPAFRVLFGASVRNDPEFATVAERVLNAATDVIATLIEIDGSDEQRRILAHALIGIAEATSRAALSDPDADIEVDELAQWVSELAWFGLRGVRTADVTVRQR
jgi:AcrR family transcriptional regulator